MVNSQGSRDRTQQSGQISVPLSPEIQRLRRTESVGVVQLRPQTSLFHNTGWFGQRFALLDRLQQRTTQTETTSDSPALVFATPVPHPLTTASQPLIAPPPSIEPPVAKVIQPAKAESTLSSSGTVVPRAAPPSVLTSGTAVPGAAPPLSATASQHVPLISQHVPLAAEKFRLRRATLPQADSAAVPFSQSQLPTQQQSKEPLQSFPLSQQATSTDSAKHTNSAQQEPHSLPNFQTNINNLENASQALVSPTPIVPEAPLSEARSSLKIAPSRQIPSLILPKRSTSDSAIVTSPIFIDSQDKLARFLSSSSSEIHAKHITESTAVTQADPDPISAASKGTATQVVPVSVSAASDSASPQNPTFTERISSGLRYVWRSLVQPKRTVTESPSLPEPIGAQPAIASTATAIDQSAPTITPSQAWTARQAIGFIFRKAVHPMLAPESTPKYPTIPTGSEAFTQAGVYSMLDRPPVMATALPTPAIALSSHLIWRKALAETTSGFSVEGIQSSIEPLTHPAIRIARQPATSTPMEIKTNDGDATNPTANSMNIGHLAEEVSRILARQYTVERERRGINPW